jgi:hypothetical protein
MEIVNNVNQQSPIQYLVTSSKTGGRRFAAARYRGRGKNALSGLPTSARASAGRLRQLMRQRSDGAISD